MWSLVGSAEIWLGGLSYGMASCGGQRQGVVKERSGKLGYGVVG